MKSLAIVPARGGSKRLVRKNARLFCGTPLIQRTIKVVERCFERVIVTSDDVEILDLVCPSPIVMLDKRPSFLATDESKVIDTVSYYFDKFCSDDFEQIWLCLPTCPLRSVDDLDAGIKILNKNIDGVVSVTPYDFPPTLALGIDPNNLLTGFGDTHPFAEGNSRSQDHADAFRPNGAFYGMWWQSFGENRNFFRGKVRPYVMPKLRSLDIDTEEDFLIAELVAKKNWLSTGC